MGDSSGGNSSAPGLRRGILGPIPSIGQTLGALALSAGVGTGIALVFGSAGRATWLAFVFATVAMLSVAFGVAVFATRMSTTGQFYNYAAQGIGSAGGWLTGWSMVIAYIGGCIFSTLGSATAFVALSLLLHLPGDSLGLQVLFVLVIAGVATYVGYNDIRISTRVMLIIESLTILAILVVLFTTLATRGISDSQQATLSGASFHGTAFGIIFAIVFLTSFEVAASLGIETHNARRTIPLVFMACIIGGGIFLIFSSYVMVLGFDAAKIDVASSASPINDLSSMVGLTGFAYVIDFGVGLAFFAAVVAQINSASRLLLVMSHEKMMPRVLSEVHEHTRTPYRGVLLIGAIAIAVPVVLILTTRHLGDAFADAGTTDSFAYIGGYLLISLAAPLYLLRLKQLKPQNIAAAIVAYIALLAVGYTSLVPSPPFPLNVFAYAYFVLMVVGLGWYLVVRQRSPQAVASLGQHDIEFAPGSDPSKVTSVP